MLQENLSHARHVELERLTYHGVFTALVAGSLAFFIDTDTLGNDGALELSIKIRIMICLILILMAFLSIVLNERWTNAFDRHLKYAKGCYYMLHRDLIEIDYDDIISQNEFRIDHEHIKHMAELHTVEFIPFQGEKPCLDRLPMYCFRINAPAEILRGRFLRTKWLLRIYYFCMCIILGIVLFWLWEYGISSGVFG